MINWISEQTEKGRSQFDVCFEEKHPDFKHYVSNAESYLRVIQQECNFYDALNCFDWPQLLKNAETILDLGCGGGWLSARISVFDGPQTIYALDSSRRFLYSLLPEVIKKMGGEEKKIYPIEGLFMPLLFPDSSLDAIVASSVFHHAENLPALFRECRRKIKPGGRLFILNETPYSGIRHLLSTSKAFIRIFLNLSLHRYIEAGPSISSSGFLYDPQLGDRDYPLWYWHKAITASGFVIESFVDTGLPTVKRKSGRSLKHYVCRVP
jgi:SAM-dependent methyltransferase